MIKKSKKQPDDTADDNLFDYDMPGEEFAFIRSQAGLTQRDIAMYCNKQRQSIGRIERRNVIPMWIIDVLRGIVTEEFMIVARNRYAKGDRL